MSQSRAFCARVRARWRQDCRPWSCNRGRSGSRCTNGGGGGLGLERQVGEIVERGEDGELRELRHAGHHHEADVGSVVLDFTVESGKLGADGRGLGDIVHRGANGRVILVDQDDHGLAALCGHRLNGLCKVVVWRERRVVNDLGLRKCLSHTCHEPCVKILEGIHFHRGKVEVEHGILCPIVVQLVDGQALKEVALALEDTLQRGEHQRLAEAPRTRDEEELPADINPLDQAIERLGLVHINEFPLPQFAEVAYVLRNPLFHLGPPCLQYSKPRPHATLSGENGDRKDATMGANRFGLHRSLCGFAADRDRRPPFRVCSPFSGAATPPLWRDSVEIPRAARPTGAMEPAGFPRKTVFAVKLPRTLLGRTRGGHLPMQKWEKRRSRRSSA